ncbi:unnamed protein product [Staurois parvus]|uniref:Uncharacterized protein n=1 Tax=Staurois parvus TaxID=386267 RepID=A0ABN9CPY0_9NEOB|nr:unnamed protein product [Staurois parvus]
MHLVLKYVIQFLAESSISCDSGVPISSISSDSGVPITSQSCDPGVPNPLPIM